VRETLTKLVKSNFLQTMLKFAKFSNLFVRYQQYNKRVTKTSLKKD